MEALGLAVSSAALAIAVIALLGTMRPVSEWLVERLDPRPGQTILDVAAGLGETGFLAAPHMGGTRRWVAGNVRTLRRKPA